MDHTEGPARRKKYYRVFTSTNFSFHKGQSAHTISILYRVPEEIPALTTVLRYHKNLLHSMADPSIIYLPFFLFTRSTTEYCNQSTSETYRSKWKPGEDHSSPKECHG